jgi:hypothetical protein
MQIGFETPKKSIPIEDRVLFACAAALAVLVASFALRVVAAALYSENGTVSD